MEATYRNVDFRQPDGSVITRPVRTVPMPENFYDKAYADHLKETHPDLYIEYMHDVDEAFLANLEY